MSILRLFKPDDKPKRSAGFSIDVRGLLASGFNRYVVYMTKGEVLRHLTRAGTDITGHIVIVGGLGVVDGYSKIRQKNTKLPVTIFEMRTAQTFIDMPLGKLEKNEYGFFKPESLGAQLMVRPDLIEFDGKDHG